MHKLTKRLNTTAIPFHALFWFAICLQCAPTVARADDFCALTVNIVGWDGAPNNRTWIELLDPTGKVELREMAEGPSVKICDFGFGEHTLRVGANECFPVAISGLRVVFGSPISLKVVQNACSYRNMRNACLGYFRIVDIDGKPIANVGFSPGLTLAPPQTDSHGRWQGLFKGSHDLTFTKTGFEPERAHVECRADEEVDQTIIMKKR